MTPYIWVLIALFVVTIFVLFHIVEKTSHFEPSFYIKNMNAVRKIGVRNRAKTLDEAKIQGQNEEEDVDLETLISNFKSKSSRSLPGISLGGNDLGGLGKHKKKLSAEVLTIEEAEGGIPKGKLTTDVEMQERKGSEGSLDALTKNFLMPSLSNSVGSRMVQDGVRRGSTVMFQHGLLRFGDPTVGSSFGYSLLHEAAMLQRRSLVAALVKKFGIPVDHRNSFGATSLMKALEQKRSDINVCLELILEGGADVNARDYLGNTVLMRGIQAGNRYVVALLKKFNVDVDAVNPEGETALEVALKSGNSRAATDLGGHMVCLAPSFISPKVHNLSSAAFSILVPMTFYVSSYFNDISVGVAQLQANRPLAIAQILAVFMPSMIVTLLPHQSLRDRIYNVLQIQLLVELVTSIGRSRFSVQFGNIRALNLTFRHIPSFIIQLFLVYNLTETSTIASLCWTALSTSLTIRDLFIAQYLIEDDDENSEKLVPRLISLLFVLFELVCKVGLVLWLYNIDASVLAVFLIYNLTTRAWLFASFQVEMPLIHVLICPFSSAPALETVELFITTIAFSLVEIAVLLLLPLGLSSDSSTGDVLVQSLLTAFFFGTICTGVYLLFLIHGAEWKAHHPFAWIPGPQSCSRFSLMLVSAAGGLASAVKTLFSCKLDARGKKPSISMGKNPLTHVLENVTTSKSQMKKGWEVLKRNKAYLSLILSFLMVFTLTFFSICSFINLYDEGNSKVCIIMGIQGSGILNIGNSVALWLTVALFLVSVAEATTSRFGKALSNSVSVERGYDLYLKEISRKPCITWEVKCYQKQEKTRTDAQGKTRTEVIYVLKHQATEKWKFSRWFDASDPFPTDIKFGRIKYETILCFGDAKTFDQYESDYSDFRSRNTLYDLQKFTTSVDSSSINDCFVSLPDEKNYFCSFFWFFISVILQLSAVYRMVMTMKFSTTKRNLVKVIYKQGSEEEDPSRFHMHSETVPLESLISEEKSAMSMDVYASTAYKTVLILGGFVGKESKPIVLEQMKALEGVESKTTPRRFVGVGVCEALEEVWKESPNELITGIQQD